MQLTYLAAVNATKQSMLPLAHHNDFLCSRLRTSTQQAHNYSVRVNARDAIMRYFRPRDNNQLHKHVLSSLANYQFDCMPFQIASILGPWTLHLAQDTLPVPNTHHWIRTLKAVAKEFPPPTLTSWAIAQGPRHQVTKHSWMKEPCTSKL